MRRALVLAGVACLHCYSGAGTLPAGAGSTGAAPPSGTSPTGEAPPSSSSSSVGSSSGAVDHPSTGATTGAATTGGESSSSTTTVDPPPEPPAIRYVGRHDASDPGHVRMGWSGVGAVFRFLGTGARVRLDDKGRYFTVLVDGALQANLTTSPGEQLYPLAEGLPAGEHTIELYRRTEGSFGPTVILGVEIDGELLAPPPVQRRIELIGDSITCGYGNEGVAPCSFSAETENHYLTYGAVAARALAAELSTVAWSGKGLVNNFGDDVFEPLPTFYDRLLASDPVPWDFSWQPDAVVINIGTNDFSTDKDPPENVFVPAYVAFLEHLRSRYPGAFILAIAPSLYGAEVQLVAGYLQGAVAQRHAAGDTAVAFADVNVQWVGSGCDGHPTAATHAAMGAKLADTLKAQLGW